VPHWNDTLKLFLRTAKQRPASFFDAHVKSVLICGSLQTVEFLQCCSWSNVKNFACWGPSLVGVYPFVQNLQPRRLSVRLDIDIQPTIVTSPSGFFANLTHLEILDGDDWDDASTIILLPSLTHLSFVFEERLSRPTSECMKEILSDCKSLAVLLLLPNDNFTLDPGWDSRLVLLWHESPEYVRDWENGCRGLPCIWTIAEEMVAQRKKQIQRKDTLSH
jgi:hypothetical protein